MHRITGQGTFEKYDGKRIAVDGQTIDCAMDQNAIQEEICNVVTRGGLTVRGDDDDGYDPLDDWALVPDQMSKAIFENGSIGNDAISDNSLYLAKILFPANRVDGDDEIDFTITELKFSNSGDFGKLTKDGLWTQESGINTEIYGKGINYPNGPGNNSNFPSARIRKTAFDVDKTLSWSQSGAGDMYSTTLNLVTTLPIIILGTTSSFGTGILGAWVQDIHDAPLIRTSPAAVAVQTDGGYVKVTELTVFGNSGDPGNQFTLILEYDASALS